MSHKLVALSLVVALIALAPGGVAGAPRPAPQAALPVTSGVAYETFTGADFRALDSDTVVRFVNGTGGGVQNLGAPGGAGANNDRYLEARVQLPQGARVVETTFFYRDCFPTFAGPYAFSFYFGAYEPAAGGFTSFTQGGEAPAAKGPNCTTTVAVAVPLATQPVVDSAQRSYKLGVRFHVIGATGTSANVVIFVGARIGYTFPLFVPSARRD
jgi:hypothetical protein